MRVALLEAVHGRDVRVVERGQEARLPLEALDPGGVGGEGLGQDLDRHLAVQAGVAGFVDLSHAAAPERSYDLERSQARTRGESCRWHVDWVLSIED